METTENQIRFSGHTLDKAVKAKVTLENYYSNLVHQNLERKQRSVHRNTITNVILCRLRGWYGRDKWRLVDVLLEGCVEKW